MAKIVETIIIVKLSQLVRDNEPGTTAPAVFTELPATVEQVVQELVGKDVVVEVEKAQ